MLLCIGDSFTAPTPGQTAWPGILGQRLGTEVANRAVPGSGYVAPGIGSTPARFSRQLLVAVQDLPGTVDGIVLFGSVNDRTVAGDPYWRATVYQTLLLLGQAYPLARQLIVGPQWSGPDPLPPELPRLRDGILEAMWGLAWQYPYIDPIPAADPGQWWFPPGQPELWGPDRFHPSQAGQVRIADRIEPHLRRILGL